MPFPKMSNSSNKHIFFPFQQASILVEIIWSRKIRFSCIEIFWQLFFLEWGGGGDSNNIEGAKMNVPRNFEISVHVLVLCDSTFVWKLYRWKDTQNGGNFKMITFCIPGDFTFFTLSRFLTKWAATWRKFSFLWKKGSS